MDFILLNLWLCTYVTLALEWSCLWGETGLSPVSELVKQRRRAKAPPQPSLLPFPCIFDMLSAASWFSVLALCLAASVTAIALLSSMVSVSSAMLINYLVFGSLRALPQYWLIGGWFAMLLEATAWHLITLPFASSYPQAQAEMLSLLSFRVMFVRGLVALVSLSPSPSRRLTGTLGRRLFQAGPRRSGLDQAPCLRIHPPRP